MQNQWTASFAVRLFLVTLVTLPQLLGEEIPFEAKLATSADHKRPPALTIHKVSLTQNGYIQFLRYITEEDVPPLDEFTFCIWVRSNNLTYNHPILSYTRNEQERLIRAWITPKGKDIKLEILEQEVLSVSVNLRENHWYHICQSWDSHSGAWNLYTNGKLRASGFVPKLRGTVIPGKGDIVVGQEYTDFDKGLDDGIEGDIFGFNLVLSSTSTPASEHSNFISPYETNRRRQWNTQPDKAYQLITKKRQYYPFNHQLGGYYQPHNSFPTAGASSPPPSSIVPIESDVPQVLSYFNTQPNRAPKSFLGMSSDFMDSFLNYFTPKSSYKIPVRTITVDDPSSYLLSRHSSSPVQRYYILKPSGSAGYGTAKYTGNSRIISDNLDSPYQKPLGLMLVELGYNCILGRGAPIDHKKVLINWTKTPVRVFGGAILKNIEPFCV